MTAIINGFDKPDNSHKINYVRIISSSGKSYDITNIFLSILIFEDLRGDSTDGEIVIVDSNDIMSNIPIQGREELHVSFASRDNDGSYFKPYEKVFSIVSASDYIRDEVSKLTTVKLNFVQKAFLDNVKIKISKSFDDIPSNIVRSVCGTVNIIPNVEDCLFRRKFISPNISPFSFIKLLAEESTSKLNNSSDFCFFENKEGYHFKSVYTLSRQKPSHTLKYNLEGFGVSNINFDIENVDEFYNEQPFNIIEQYDGALGSTLYTHDVIKKKQIKTDIDYYTYLNDFPSMNKGNLYIDNSMVQSKSSKVLYDIADTIYATNSDSNINQRLKKIINRTLLESSPSTMVLPGNVNILTGQTLNFEYRTEGDLDIFKSGIYLIEKIKHELTPATYSMTLGVIKNSNIKTNKKL